MAGFAQESDDTDATEGLGASFFQLSKGIEMLVLARKLEQTIVINENIEIRVLNIKGNQIKLGITAPVDVPVVRGELPTTKEYPND